MDHDGTRSRWSIPPILAAAGACAGAVTVTTVWDALGVMSLPGLGVLAAFAMLTAALVLTRITWLPVVVLPSLIILPLAGPYFPAEYLLVVVGIVMALHGLRARDTSLARFTHLEVWNIAFVAWALATAFWAFDTLHLVLGVRRLLIGVLSGWVAYRLAGRVPRWAYEAGLVGGGIAVASAALLRSLGSGLSMQATLFHRATATDLGWGTANYVASLLLLLSPPSLAILLSPRPRWMRVGAAIGLTLAAALQILVASRAATILFFGGLLVQVFFTLSNRSRWTGAIVVLSGLTLALVSPYGAGLLGRFSAPRDLGSMVVRVWYFREGWQRIIDFFPFGMGLNQGIPYPDKMSGIDLHNYWLAVTSELGVIGLTLWVGAMVVQIIALRRLRADPRHRTFGLALQVTFWLGQLHTLVEPTFQGRQYQFLWFWIALGFLGYARALPAPKPSAAASSER